jgi:hypothetical protein
MSSPNLTEPGPETGLYRKPRADVFTMLLVIALLAVLLGIWALYAFMQDYDMNFKGKNLGVARPAGLQIACRTSADGCV